MSATLSAAERDRFVKRGLTWEQVIAAGPPSPRSPLAELAANSTLGQITLVLRSSHLLTPWEQDFARSHGARAPRSWSRKECAVFDAIVDKVRAATGERP